MFHAGAVVLSSLFLLQLLMPPFLGETGPPRPGVLLVFEVFEPNVKDGHIAPTFADFALRLNAGVHWLAYEIPRPQLNPEFGALPGPVLCGLIIPLRPLGPI